MEKQDLIGKKIPKYKTQFSLKGMSVLGNLLENIIS